MSNRLARICGTVVLLAMGGCYNTDPYRQWQYEKVETYLAGTARDLQSIDDALGALTAPDGSGRELPAALRREKLKSIGEAARRHREQATWVCDEVRMSRREVRVQALEALVEDAGLDRIRKWLVDRERLMTLREAAAEAPLRRTLRTLDGFLEELRRDLKENP